MPGFLFHVAASAICPHGGQVSTITTNGRVLASGQPVATLGDQFLVAGCAFNVSGVLHPCVKVQWLAPAARVLVGGQPAILQTSSGLCQAADQAPQGAPLVIATQARATGS